MRVAVGVWCVVASATLVGCDELTDKPPVESLSLAELTKAFCTDGTIGYVRNVDLDGDMPRNPIEAAARTVPDSFIIPCYAQDGVTVIGEFEIGGGEVEMSP